MLAGFFILILFYSGAYLFVRKYFKTAPAFSLLFINLAIILILFFFSLAGLLAPAVWFLTISGASYFASYILRNRKAIVSDIFRILSGLLEKFQLFYQKQITLKTLLMLCVSFSAAFTFLNLVFNLWVHPRWLIIAALIGLCGGLFIAISLASGFYLKLFQEKAGFRIFAIAVMLLSIALFVLVLSGNQFLVPRTDEIIIQVGETSTGQTGAVTLLEIKDLDTQKKLVPAEPGSWQDLSQTGNQAGMRSDLTGDALTFFSSGKGPVDYQFLFKESPASGSVEIRINGKTHTYNLKSNAVNQRIVEVSSSYFPADLLVLISQFVFSLAAAQSAVVLLFALREYGDEFFSSKYVVFLFVLALIVLLFFLTRPMTFWERDEFSHWGTFIREVSIKNGLPGSEFCTSFPHYIPGITLFEYFFTRMLGYSEGHAYFAYLFLILTMITPVFVQAGKDIFANILYFLAMIIMLFILPLKFISLYVDAPLGLLFGAGIIYLLTQKERPLFFGGIFLIFCGLQLLKTWGLVFSSILAGVFILDELITAINNVCRSEKFYLDHCS